MCFAKKAVLSCLLAVFSIIGVAQNIVSNPTTSQTITQPANTSFTVQGATLLPSVTNLNNVLWVDGVNYKTLKDCYNALPNGPSIFGGTCMVPPNYTETLSDTLVMKTPGAGFRFTGPAQITLAQNPSTKCGDPLTPLPTGINVPQGTTGAFIISDTPPGFDSQSTTFIVPSGFSGNAFCAGTSGGNTVNLTMRNIRFDVFQGANSSTGVYLARVTGCEMDSVNVVGNFASSTTQRGFVLDGSGTNGFTGYCTFINPSEGGLNIGIQFRGSGTNTGNASTIINNTITGLSGSNSICFDFLAGSQNTVLGGDCEGVTTAVHFGSASGNEVFLRDESITNDVLFDSTSNGNIVHMLVYPTRISDSGTHNSVIDADLVQNNGYLWRQFATSTYWGVANYQTNLSRIYMNSANTFISAETGGVIFNASSGNGVQFFNGNGGQVASVDSSGNAQFNGNLSVSGVKSFRIDHPLSPEKKYLYHAAIESPDMKNMYDGVAILGAKGAAVVKLPAYFEALNKDFRYQLTCIGASAPVYIAREIRGNRFVIAGGRPGLKVSWQVTGIRHDAFANAHRMVVEQEKPAEESRQSSAPPASGASQ